MSTQVIEYLPPTPGAMKSVFPHLDFSSMPSMR